MPAKHGMKSSWKAVVHAHENLFIAYAVHTSGKVEREGAYKDKIDGILNAHSFARILNQYHRYAGKYEGKDKLLGDPIPQEEIDATIDRHDKAWKVYMEKMKPFLKRHKK